MAPGAFTSQEPPTSSCASVGSRMAPNAPAYILNACVLKPGLNHNTDDVRGIQLDSVTEDDALVIDPERSDDLQYLDHDSDVGDYEPQYWDGADDLDDRCCDLQSLQNTELQALQVRCPAADQRRVRRLAEDITVDSGAGASVGNGATLFPEWQLKPSAGSRMGVQYVGAGGERIPNQGERSGRLMFEGGVIGRSRWQEARTQKPLLAVSDLEDMGNVTIFSPSGSIIAPGSDPVVKQILDLLPLVKGSIKIHRSKGTYKIPAWIVDEPSDFPRHP